MAQKKKTESICFLKCFVAINLFRACNWSNVGFDSVPLDCSIRSPMDAFAAMAYWCSWIDDDSAEAIARHMPHCSMDASVVVVVSVRMYSGSSLR